MNSPVSDSGRPLRLCDTCLVVDDDPRHVYATSGVAGDRVTYTEAQRQQAIASAGNDPQKLLVLMRDIEDAATQMKHLDCCLGDGCPDQTCDRRLADADDAFDGGKTTGKALVAKLEQNIEKINSAQKEH